MILLKSMVINLPPVKGLNSCGLIVSNVKWSVVYNFKMLILG
jgi:hypothetical protein